MKLSIRSRAAISAAAFGVTLPFVLTVPAHADTWLYTCDLVVHSGVTGGQAAVGVGTGTGNCVASNGAPVSGTISQVFILRERGEDGTELDCQPLLDDLPTAPVGTAVLGVSVVGPNCLLVPDDDPDPGA